MAWPNASGTLSNPSFTAQVDENGVPILAGGGGYMTITGTNFNVSGNEYAIDVTSAWNFSGTTTSNGLILTVAPDGFYALSGAWTGTNESFDITASNAGEVVVETFTVTKAEPEESGEEAEGGGETGDAESDEGRTGDGPAETSQVEYTTDIRTLTDILPSTPLIYNGDDLIITLDLRLITYKPSALAEIMDREFKSY